MPSPNLHCSIRTRRRRIGIRNIVVLSRSLGVSLHDLFRDFEFLRRPVQDRANQIHKVGMLP